MSLTTSFGLSEHSLDKPYFIQSDDCRSLEYFEFRLLGLVAYSGDLVAEKVKIFNKPNNDIDS